MHPSSRSSGLPTFVMPRPLRTRRIKRGVLRVGSGASPNRICPCIVPPGSVFRRAFPSSYDVSPPRRYRLHPSTFQVVVMPMVGAGGAIAHLPIDFSIRLLTCRGVEPPRRSVERNPGTGARRTGSPRARVRMEETPQLHITVISGVYHREG